jgi:hypothetical protein
LKIDAIKNNRIEKVAGKRAAKEASKLPTIDHDEFE